LGGGAGGQQDAEMVPEAPGWGGGLGVGLGGGLAADDNDHIEGVDVLLVLLRVWGECWSLIVEGKGRFGSFAFLSRGRGVLLLQWRGHFFFCLATATS
jgi:hypothetical protein